MARSDYEHWNEDADQVWWLEEGRHVEEAPDPDEFYERQMTGFQMDCDDAYSEGEYAASNGQERKNYSANDDIQKAYDEGYADGGWCLIANLTEMRMWA